MIEGESGTIILNTHFSQKVCSESKLANTSIPRALIPVEKCTPYSLTRAFGLLEISKTSEEGESTAKEVGQLLPHFNEVLHFTSRHCYLNQYLIVLNDLILGPQKNGPWAKFCSFWPS